MARILHIDYVLEGGRRGYQFTEPTRDLDPALVKAIWQGAMPRGSAWGDAAYVGAVSLKSFPVDDRHMAACEVTITDQADELGRRGIRKAIIHLLTLDEHAAYLRERLAAIPEEIVQHAEKRLYSREWELLFRKYSDLHQPRTLIKPQTVLAHDYTPANWRFVEACILLLVTRATLLTNLIEITPKLNPFADRALSFTTLALDPRGEGRIVAVPVDRVKALGGVPYIDLR